jgi:hypothetical protein
LTADVVAVTGKPITAGERMLVEEIASLRLSRAGDPTRRARAVADLVRELGIRGTPQQSPPPPPGLRDVLAEIASHEAAEPAGASSGEGAHE